jgi:RimJ/RimL family protein N-acetyltransferase
MHTANSLAGRTILAVDDEIAIAEILDGERDTVVALCDQTYEPDPDDRPVPFQVTRYWAAILEARTGDLVGTMSWRPVPFGLTLSRTAWNLGIDLIPAARGRGLGGTAGVLLARYLFDSTEIDRVQAFTDLDNVPGWRALDKAGFHREGVLRGVTKRAGQRRDVVFYSLLRSDVG